ncbi:MAG: YceI family protein [Verrucomicrobiae bacterium]|nr:YceI family protein [Verrucomicrobiae bacterium]
MMKRIHLLPALVLLSGFLQAGEAEWTGTCKVHFSGESTLHDFEGTVATEPFTVSVSDMTEPSRATATSRVVVKAASMNTDNEKRDVEMHKCMDVTTHPEIVVEVDHLAVADTKPAADGPVPRPTVVPFKMTLMGKTHELTGRVSDWSYSDEGVSFTVSFPVSLKAAGIKPPSVLGVVKVKDEILVKASLSLKRK